MFSAIRRAISNMNSGGKSNEKPKRALIGAPDSPFKTEEEFNNYLGGFTSTLNEMVEEARNGGDDDLDE